jgi:hypothetical protein
MTPNFNDQHMNPRLVPSTNQEAKNKDAARLCVTVFSSGWWPNADFVVHGVGFLAFLGAGRSRLDERVRQSFLNQEGGGPRDSISHSPPNPTFSCCGLLLWF